MTEFQEEVLAYLNSIENRWIRVESMILDLTQAVYSIARSEYRRDKKIMLNLSALNAEVAENTDLLQSVVAMRSALEAERDDLKAQLESADASNQTLIDEIAAKQDANNKALAAVVAIAANTPADTGGSTAGNTEPT